MSDQITDEELIELRAHVILTLEALEKRLYSVAHIHTRKSYDILTNASIRYKTTCAGGLSRVED